MLVPENRTIAFPFEIILGSASPRRKQLLEGLGLQFSVLAIDANESEWPAHLRAHEVPLFLAELKSKAYPGELNENQVLITSDTIVWCDKQVLNKPLDFEEGKKMLRQLSGKMHEVYTAVCLRSAKKQKLFYDRTAVYFKTLSDTEIEYYLNHYKPYDKAGAYGAQDWIGYVGIEKIEGSFYNVMGLPVRLLYEELLIF
jgi:septum formation protein